MLRRKDLELGTNKLQRLDVGLIRTLCLGYQLLYLRCYGLLELSTLLYLVHQVPSIHILHHKVQSILKQQFIVLDIPNICLQIFYGFDIFKEFVFDC